MSTRSSAASRRRTRRASSTPISPRTIRRPIRLPPPLRHIRKDVPKTLSAALGSALKIACPPDGARIDLGLAEPGPAPSLALKALGGVPPLTWMVNSLPVAESARRQSEWSPDGAGFARISVMDASGASDSVVVRLE